jgi:phage gp29-like protein
MILPEGYELEFLNPSGSPEVFKNLIDYIDKEIALVLCGENEAGMAEAGSRASSQVANTVRVVRASELSEMLSKTLTQTLVRWIVDLNFGTDVAAPYLTREFRIEESPLTMPDVALLIQSGYTPRKEWIERHFRVELQQKDTEATATTPPDQAPVEEPAEEQELSDEDLLKEIFGDDYEIPEEEGSEEETSGKKPFGKNEKITEDEAVEIDQK